ncbi:MAG: hypothetical protein ACLQHF_08515 [Terracidiphilus sp.]
MKTRLILLLLFVFIAGIFVGIWLNWRHKTGPRYIVYQVQNYPRANLQVFPGDKISLVKPDGNSGGLVMNFVGYDPCADQAPSASCVIDTANGYAPPGPYFFTCSGDGYSCPDPGVQQSPTVPLGNTFAGAVETDLFGVQSTPPGPPPVTGGHPATTSVTAYVSCAPRKNTTVLQDLNGNSLSTIPALQGETVYWISSKPFTLNTSSFPAGLCSNGDPGGSNLTEAQCDVALSSQTITYTVQAQTTPTACTALNTAQLKIN